MKLDFLSRFLDLSLAAKVTKSNPSTLLLKVMSCSFQVVCHSGHSLVTVFSSFLGVFEDDSDAHLDRVLPENELAQARNETSAMFEVSE